MKRSLYVVLSFVLFQLSAGVAAAEDNPFLVSNTNGWSGSYRAGFITGIFQGAPLSCPEWMSGLTLSKAYDTAIRAGRITNEMDARVVLYQLMVEGGCTADPNRFKIATTKPNA